MLPRGFFSNDLELPLDVYEPVYIEENVDKWPLVVEDKGRGLYLLTKFLIDSRRQKKTKNQ